MLPVTACPSPRAAAKRCQSCSPPRWAYRSADVTDAVLAAAAGKAGDVVQAALAGEIASSLATLPGRYRYTYVRSLYAALGRLAAAGVPYRRERRLGRVVLLLGGLAEVYPHGYTTENCGQGDPSWASDFSAPCRSESWADSYARLQGQQPRSLACLAG